MLCLSLLYGPSHVSHLVIEDDGVDCKATESFSFSFFVLMA
jgi:hypothetical protein